jgi:hypothetical protein
MILSHDLPVDEAPFAFVWVWAMQVVRHHFEVSLLYLTYYNMTIIILNQLRCLLNYYAPYTLLIVSILFQLRTYKKKKFIHVDINFMSASNTRMRCRPETNIPLIVLAYAIDVSCCRFTKS